jgi:hypothetical protein
VGSKVKEFRGENSRKNDKSMKDIMVEKHKKLSRHVKIESITRLSVTCPV